MKKILLLTLITLTLTGCSWFKKDAPKGVERGAKPPVKITEVTVNTVDNFFVEADKNGLVLKLDTDVSFGQKLSNHPIESYEIKEGILTFVENTEQGSRTQAFNLNELVQIINQS